MANSKTLTPTNVTIQIPEFTDQPDQRVNSNCIDKEADAINAINSKLPVMGSMTATITDSTYGFIDSGILSTNYVILCAYTLLSANNYVRISNINSGNYRFQIVSATGENVVKSGTYYLYYWYIPR